jgi:hypothetical protein
MKNIASALVKAQKAFGPALKTSTNPHFRSRYADLSACVEAVMGGLNDNGIALVQQTHECESGVLVETLFIHESGETFSAGKLHVPASKNDAMGYGSALTYARRYSLMAACGIAPEDDDGQAASRPSVAQVSKPVAKVIKKEPIVPVNMDDMPDAPWCDNWYSEVEATIKEIDKEATQWLIKKGALEEGQTWRELKEGPYRSRILSKGGASAFVQAVLTTL